MAASRQLPETHRLKRSPILLAFQAIPRNPVCDRAFCLSLKISGYKLRANEALQISISNITSKDGKSKRALITTCQSNIIRKI